MNLTPEFVGSIVGVVVGLLVAMVIQGILIASQLRQILKIISNYRKG